MPDVVHKKAATDYANLTPRLRFGQAGIFSPGMTMDLPKK